MARINYRGLIHASISAILIQANILPLLAIPGDVVRRQSITSSITANSRSRRVKNDSSQQHYRQKQNHNNDEEMLHSSLRSRSSSSSSRRSFGDVLMETAQPYHEFKAELEASGGRILESHRVQNPHNTLPEFMRVNVKTNSDKGEKNTPRRHRRRRLDGDDDYAYNDDADDDENDEENEDDEENDDDEEEEKGYEYYMDDDSIIDFSGYSFIYTQCQPIQRFSEQAALGGEYSPLVTDEIVLFRFCPQRRCNIDAANGCLSGYGEYVVSLKNYLRAKLYYEYDKKANVCEFCKKCGYRRRRVQQQERQRRRLGDDYYAADDGDDGDDNGGDDGNNDGDDYYGADDDDDNGGYYNDDDDDSDVKLCSTYADVCSDYSYECDVWYSNQKNDGEDKDSEDGDDGSSYMDYLDYLDHLDCQQSENNKNGGAYYLKPHCDIYKDSIYMGAFMDPYCSQYAGSDVRVSDYLSGSFQKDIFQDLNAKECIKCAQNNYPPFYNANSNFCNRLYADSGHCNTYIAYSLGDDDDDGSSSSSSSSSSSRTGSTCSFAESIRYGTYDKDGQIAIYSARSSGSSSGSNEVTSGQVVSLVLLTLIITGLSLYSCYLHHSITNFLLTKLTYQGALLPTNMKIRHSKRSHKSAASSGGGGNGGNDSKSHRSRQSKRSHAEERVGPTDN